MYVRRKKNKSGTISVQVIEKRGGKSVLLKTIGCSSEAKEINLLVAEGERYIEESKPQVSLDFTPKDEDRIVEEYFSSSNNNFSITTVGPDLILGGLFERMGFEILEDSLLKNMVISRLVYPVSKLRTTEYLLAYQGKSIDVSKIYRFLDEFNAEHKERIEKIAYDHTRKLLKKISVLFYDMDHFVF